MTLPPIPAHDPDFAPHPDGAPHPDVPPPDGDWMVEAIDLVKTYGEFEAVKGLTLRVRRGEIFGFLGPNGAGKTTTIRILTGLLQPTSGVVRIGGHDLATDSLAARAITSLIPDTPYLYDKLTGREFIHFVAGLYGTPPDVAERRMAELLDVFDLTDRADDLIEGYSHGMRQKTLMIAALVHDPKVLFLDEPTVGLDPRSAKLMRDVYRQLAARGTTILLSTHILEIAERMCDRIGIIDHGELIALGTMDELRHLAAHHATLEDIFLELTGGSAFAEIARVLE
ncbi:MAG: ABC transporter ATP-binding protein [Ardenticatenales bacterium]